MFKPLWDAFRAAFLATAVFWALTYVVERAHFTVPWGLTTQAVFFVVFFFGVLWVRK
jgi:hypothetical protein